MREINIKAIYDCYLDIHFNYELKCNPDNEIAFNKELDNYEESSIWDYSFLEELIHEGISSLEEINSILIDMYSGSSNYNFQDKKIIISIPTQIIFNFNLISEINNIESYLNNFNIKSTNENLKINVFELSSFNYKSEYIN